MVRRRVSRARYELRVGTRQLVILGVVFIAIAALTFALGVLVGRDLGAKRVAVARMDEGKVPPRSDGLRPEPPPKTTAARTEERLTFYRTLTAPTPELSPIGKPTIEERLIPRESAAAPTESDEARPRPAPRPAVPVARLEPPRPSPPARAAVAAPGASAVATTVDPAPWTVQVGSFRSRALAEELRARLATRGFDAYVLPSVTEEGRPRYRVRVGAYSGRAEAERAAADLRAERGLTPQVTPRPR